MSSKRKDSRRRNPEKPKKREKIDKKKVPLVPERKPQRKSLQSNALDLRSIIVLGESLGKIEKESRKKHPFHESLIDGQYHRHFFYSIQNTKSGDIKFGEVMIRIVS